jgi:Mn2+/Fe2+ NRAMP family transporter
MSGLEVSFMLGAKKAPLTFRQIMRALGPGLVTGAADDDPSGIATYSQAGAQFGFNLLWTVFLTTPFMIAIQLVSAQRTSSYFYCVHFGLVAARGKHFQYCR